VQYLVQQGASLNQRSKDGKTPLSAATDEGHLKLANYLREQGAGV
jgi:ankyrin repeat protein